MDILLMRFLILLRKLIGLFVRYFIRGVILFLPAIVTFYLLWFLLDAIDSILPVGFPGLGILLLIVGLTVLGYISTHWLGPTLIAGVEERIRKIPLIGFIYASIRELIDDSRRSFRFDRPVLVQPDPTVPVYHIGFLTHTCPLPNKPLVAVYLPYSFSFMGNLLLVSPEQVSELGMKSADALRFVVAGGLITPSVPSKSSNHE
ncbi:MAG: DUF502 domain-containing protein [Bacteroidia bacterium]|nr:DUF502 domain-containing protein [Bacteroidia bacterium]MDW8134247.1 DUF502 domain-containing protein [Bacteroidia bacterium]